MKRLTIVLLLLSASCTPPRPQPVPPMPPPPTMVGVTFQIQDGTGHTVDSATVAGVGRLTGQWMAFTNGVGLLLVTLTPDHYELTVSAAGYTTRELPADVSEAGTITIGLERVDLPRLITRGQFFGLETGERWTAIEASDFNLFGRYENNEDISLILTERAALGFNLLRVWTLYDVVDAGIGRLIPSEHQDFYDRLSEFLRLCASHGLYAELTAFTGTSRLLPAQADQQAHLDHLANVVRSATNAILETGNEYEQGDNWWSLDLNYPTGLLVSAGSVGAEKWPTALGLPSLGYEEFHTNGAFQWHRKAGHNGMEIADASHRPVIANENTRFPDNDASEAHAFDAAAGAALLIAGSAYHSVHGKNSQPFDAQELATAAAWVAGAKSVNLACQAGGYRHRTDLETAGILRAYDRNVPGIDCAVRIRQ